MELEVLRNIQATALPFNVKPFIDITEQLPCRIPDPEPRRTRDKITHVSVHHSAVEGATIQSYANHHVNTLGWAHIGYHAVVKGDQVYQTNDLSTFSYHTSSNNSYTVSVSISGDLSKRPPSEIERLNLYAVILTYMGLFDIPAENVWGHNQFPGNNTSCPCIDMDKVREDIRHYSNLMQSKDSWQAKLSKVGELANQYNYMWSLIQKGESDGDAQWGMNQLLDVRDVLISKGLLDKPSNNG